MVEIRAAENPKIEINGNVLIPAKVFSFSGLACSRSKPTNAPIKIATANFWTRANNSPDSKIESEEER